MANDRPFTPSESVTPQAEVGSAQVDQFCAVADPGSGRTGTGEKALRQHQIICAKLCRFGQRGIHTSKEKNRQ